MNGATWTLVTGFDVELDEAGEFVAAWERSHDYLQAQPGFVDSVLHEALEADTPYRYVSIDHWDSVEHFQQATQNADFRENAADLRLFSPRPGLYRVVHT